MNRRHLYIALNYGIVFIWLVNGLFCKILNFVPRHEQIVSRILGVANARSLTVFIGISEIFMAVWILSGIKPVHNAIVQITIILAMNSLEFVFAPDLLLWGKWNALFACILAFIIYYNQFILLKKQTR